MRQVTTILLRGCAVRSLMVIVVLGSTCWGAETLTPEQYQERLQVIDAALADGQRTQALTMSTLLDTSLVAWPSGPLHADPTISVLVAASANAQARLRIAAVVSACGPAMSGVSASAPGPAPADAAARLARLAQHEAETQRGLRIGGTIPGLPQEDLPLPERWRDQVMRAIDWVRDGLGKLFDWLVDWLRGRHDKDHAGGSGTLVQMLSCVLVGLILVVVVVMAWRSWWTRSAPVPKLMGIPAADSTDADPRSRAVDEWLAYAQHLTAAGRHREATRAWFHALLVQCWSHGLIHHRVGKTNWEYALLLPGHLEWRSSFQELTRDYDSIWYGGRDDREAVAHFAGETQQILATLRQQDVQP